MSKKMKLGELYNGLNQFTRMHEVNIRDNYVSLDDVVCSSNLTAIYNTLLEYEVKPNFRLKKAEGDILSPIEVMRDSALQRNITYNVLINGQKWFDENYEHLLSLKFDEKVLVLLRKIENLSVENTSEIADMLATMFTSEDEYELNLFVDKNGIIIYSVRTAVSGGVIRFGYMSEEAIYTIFNNFNYTKKLFEFAEYTAEEVFIEGEDFNQCEEMLEDKINEFIEELN